MRVPFFPGLPHSPLCPLFLKKTFLVLRGENELLAQELLAAFHYYLSNKGQTNSIKRAGIFLHILISFHHSWGSNVNVIFSWACVSES